MKKLKERWGITSNFQLLIILIVFAITGSASVWVAKPFLAWIGLDRANFPDAAWSDWVYWFLRLVLIFPFYQVLLVFFGFVFGQFKFFWAFEKKMLKVMGLGFLVK
ncbi:MAG: diacylglyceryl transferase [Flavobacteriaceae bacterium]|nr:diacylglyceryl transferase [Flavobacteriaceae bacterium]MDH3796725.1 diacylglyceryl transferase [Flavobacteriaceae bacterium]